MSAVVWLRPVLASLIGIILVDLAYLVAVRPRSAFYALLTSNLLLVAGAVMLYLQDRVPAFVGLTLSNYVILAGYLFTGLTYQRLLEIPLPKRRITVFMALALVVFSAMVAMRLDQAQRTIIVSSFIYVILVALGILLWRSRRILGVAVYLLAGLYVFISSLVMAFRIVDAAILSAGAPYFISTEFSNILLNTTFSNHMVMNVAVFMVHARLRQREAERSLAEALRQRELAGIIISLIGHDLRSPLSVIRQSSALLQDSAGEASRDSVRLVDESAVAALNLLEDLVYWGKGQQDGLKLREETLALEPVVEWTWSYLASRAGEKKVTMNCGIPPAVAVRADPKALEAVLRNLLSNAVKFSHAGEPIEVTVVEGDVPATLKLVVRDRGVGMSADRLAAYREGRDLVSLAGTRREIGMGIGVQMVIAICRTAGWQIEVDSLPGKGTTVTLVLPRV